VVFEVYRESEFTEQGINTRECDPMLRYHILTHQSSCSQKGPALWWPQGCPTFFCFMGEGEILS